MSGALEGCTCLWTGDTERRSVYIADDKCPARPHPRSITNSPT